MEVRLPPKEGYVSVEAVGPYDALAEGCTAPVRFAVLVKPEQMLTKTLEDSAINRGVPVRTTASIEEAYGFLGIAPPG